MPTYQFGCTECKTEFEVTCAIQDRNKKHRCEKCKSTKTERIFAPLADVWQTPGAYKNSKRR